MIFNSFQQEMVMSLMVLGEQWNDGSNTLCIRPGVVVTYDRKLCIE